MLPNNEQILQDIIGSPKKDPTVEALRAANQGEAATSSFEQTATTTQAADTATATGLNTDIVLPPKPSNVIPFGALGVDESGNPYYGHGVQGWIRQTFADLFDPQKNLSSINLTTQERDTLDANISLAQGKLDAFAEPFKKLGIDLPAITGLDSQTLAEGLTSYLSGKDLMFAHGATNTEATLMGASNSLRMGKDFIQRVAWGLLDLTGLDWLMRNDTANSVANREFLKQQGIDSPIPQIFDVTLIGGLFTPAKVWNSGLIAKGIVEGKFTFKEYAEFRKPYLRGSEMAYTMVFQKDTVDRFQEQISKGVDPGIAARNLENPLIELTGSIFGDPTNFLGAGIPTLAKVDSAGNALEAARFGLHEFKIGGRAVNLGFDLPWRIAGRIPEFGELISPVLKIGKYRQEAEAVQFMTPEPIFEKLIRDTGDAPSPTEVVRALQKDVTETTQRLRVVNEAESLAKARQAADELLKTAQELEKSAKGSFQTAEAATKMEEAKAAAQAADEALKKWSKGAKKVIAGDYGFATLNSTGKASVIGRDMTLVISSTLASEGPAGAMRILSDLRTLYSSTSSEQDAADALVRIVASKGLGGLLTSKAGRLTGTTLSILDSNFFDELLKYSNDADKFTQHVFSTLDEKLMKIFPSVDEMLESASRVKLARSKGVLPNATDIRLAAQYDALPEYVKVSNKAVFGWLNKVHGANVKAQSLVYMGWNPGFAIRNVTGQTVLMSMMFGPQTGAELSARAVGNSLNDTMTASFIDRMAKNMEKAKIPIPMELHKGITEAQSITTAAKDFRRLAQNNERATSASIIEHVAMQEIRKFGAKNAEQLAKGLLDDKVIDQPLYQLLTDILKKHDYNEADAIPEFRQALSGEWREAFREVPLPETLHYYMHETGRLPEVYDLAKNAKSPEEFLAGTQKILDDISKGVLKAATDEPAMLGEDVKKAYPELLEHHILMQERISRGEVDILSALESDSVAATQAFTKAQTHLESFVDKVLAKLAGLGTPEGQQATNELITNRNAWRQWWMGDGSTKGVYHQYTDVMNKANELYRRARNESDFIKLWNESFIAGTDFKLADIYPNVDPSTLNYRTYSSKLWEGYAFWKQEHWMTGNEKMISKQLAAVEKSLNMVGAKMEDVVAANADGVNPYTEFQRMVAEAHYWSVRGTIDPEIKNMMKTLPAGTKVGQMVTEAGTFASADKASKSIFDLLDVTPSHALNMVNKDRRAKELSQLADINQVEVSELINSVLRRATPKVPYPYAGNDSFARAWWEAMPALKKDYKYWQSQIADNWGKVEKVANLSPEQEVAMSKRIATYASQMTETRTMAARLGVGIRDKLLFDYRKTYADMGLSYLKPFGYWQNRAYATTLELIAANPKYANIYRAIKKYAQQEHAGMPDYYKQMMGLKLPGMDGELFFNFEANLNPVYTMLGVDFNDPKKRVDALTSAVDDMGKIGGANNTILNWAMAMYLSAKGEKEASRRWAGRAFPATSAVKALLNLNMFGDKDLLQLLHIDDISQDNWFVNRFIRHGDFDPMTWLTSNTNMDAYEEGRVNNALAQMALDGQVTQEQAIDASINRSGQTWNQAAQIAADQRSVGNLIGFVGGPGFRARSQSDVQIETFYSQYYQLVSMKSLMTSEQYRLAWDKLREGDNGKMMDSLLIGRMSGQDRDEALAYNVLGRLPPGSMSDIATEANIPQELISKFYENKGFDGWNPLDVQAFNTGILNLNAMLAIPDNATRNEWTKAKNTYSAMQAEMKSRFGDNIIERINAYYKDPNQPVSEDVQRALTFQNAMIVNNPALAKYYGGLSNIERYFYTQVYGQLDKDYPNASKYIELWSTLNLQGNSKEAKLVYDHYHLKEYFKRLDAYKDLMNKQVVEMASRLPDVEVPIRQDFIPSSAVQNRLAQIQENRFPSFETLTGDMPDVLQENVRDYFESGKKLNYASISKLKYLAEKLGYSYEEYLQLLGISLQQ